MELYAQDMFFLGETPKERSYDCCAHGKVIFTINGIHLTDGTEWCISASVNRFLHTLFENHFMGAEDFLIPCCGHTMIPSNDKKSVSIIGCNNGIDFNIIHEQENIIIQTIDDREYVVPFTDYKNAVLSYYKQTLDFYNSSPIRRFNDAFDEDGYVAFRTQCNSLYSKALALGDDIPKIAPITSKDYISHTASEIVLVSNNGISIKASKFINFRECAYNFKLANGGSGKYIGERNVIDHSFLLYTSPNPVQIVFNEKKHFICNPLTKNATISFHSFQKQILECGYYTRDIGVIYERKQLL